MKVPTSPSQPRQSPLGQDFAGGPGSGKIGGDAIMKYESILSKPKPLQGPPPGFKLDEHGNYTRTKEGFLQPPSETALLIALGHMKQSGRLEQLAANNIIQFPGNAANQNKPQEIPEAMPVGAAGEQTKKALQLENAMRAVKTRDK